MRPGSHLIGVDRRGGEGYQEVPCEVCDCSLFISIESESGICARCVQMGFPKSTQPEVNPVELWAAIEKRKATQYRREHKLSQDQAAMVFGLTRKTYGEMENGKISRVVRRKVERKLAQIEQSP